jgi:hypothetical protein
LLVLAAPAPAAENALPRFVQQITVGGPISSAPLTAAPTDGQTTVSVTGFDLVFGPGLAGNAQAQAAFAAAAAQWSAVLRNPVTLKVNVDYAPLGAGILGSTDSTILVGDYWEVRDIVADTAATHRAPEAKLLAALPTAAQFNAKLPAGFGTNGTAYITQANYLGMGYDRITDDEGSITFSSNFAWDFDPSNGIDAGKYDFVGAATHELGHILGFMSVVDTVDELQHIGMTTDQIGPFPLDFYRFDPATVGPGFNFTTAQRDLTPGGSSSFYTPDGLTPMSTGYYASGAQASHWMDWMGLGIMDPTAAPGETLHLSANDLEAMDLIGWNTVPEPATLLLLAAALPLAIRRRRTAA